MLSPLRYSLPFFFGRFGRYRFGLKSLYS
jgi:hypothetical protein